MTILIIPRCYQLWSYLILWIEKPRKARETSPQKDSKPNEIVQYLHDKEKSKRKKTEQKLQLTEFVPFSPHNVNQMNFEYLVQ